MNIVPGRHTGPWPDLTDGARSVACRLGLHECDGTVAASRLAGNNIRVPCTCVCHARHRGKL